MNANSSSRDFQQLTSFQLKTIYDLPIIQKEEIRIQEI